MKTIVFAALVLIMGTAASASQQDNNPDYKHQNSRNHKKSVLIHKHARHIIIPFDHYHI